MSQKELLLESLKRQGFSKPILDAFSKVKREDFVPKDLKKHAYEDTALPIGKGQTISQPYTIAMMFSLLDLKKGQNVMEIGSGCGYALALISEIIGNNGKVFGIEIMKNLSEKSKKNTEKYENIRIYNKNGFLGLKEKAPFDRILISAGYQEVPESLIAQLKNKGIIVAPIGTRYEQSLIAYEKAGGHPLSITSKEKKKINEKPLGITSENKLKIKKEIPGFIFVPLVKD